MASEERFGYEWQRYSKIFPEYENQFNNWIFPLKSGDILEKDILDAGCGMGRNSFFALKAGAKSVKGIDNDLRSVTAARKNLSRYKHASVDLMNIYKIVYTQKFDIIFSIGVIHHLKYPELAINKLIEALRPGGTILIWVYSYEGNEWIEKLVSPIRKKITSKLPISLLYYLTHLLSIPFFLYLKMFNHQNLYYQQISQISFDHLHSIIFDQLLPDIAHYWTKAEAYSLLNHGDLSSTSIHRPANEMGWTVTGKKRSN